MSRPSEAAFAAASEWLGHWDTFSPLSCRDDLAHAFDRFVSERSKRPCMTPGFQYYTAVKTNDLGAIEIDCVVQKPKRRLRLTERDAKAIEKAVHDAIELLIAQLDVI